MVKIIKNSNNQIKDVYENCITLGEIHIIRDTNF